MPLLQKGVQMLTRHMPKAISPTAHAILDLAFAGSFLVAGILAWKRREHKAAISSWIIAGSEVGLALATDYPGGVARLISYPTHGKIDAGMSGLISSMPQLMDFASERMGSFFRVQAMSRAAVTGLTDFENKGRALRRGRFQAA